jgi:hypothetical protein
MLLVILLVLVGMIFLGLKRLGPSLGTTRLPKPEEPIITPASEPANGDRRKPLAGSEDKPPPLLEVLTPRNQAPTETQQMVHSLTAIELSDGSVSLAQAESWKRNLQQLIQRGSEAVPAIAEFLKRNVDLNFSSLSGGNNFGYSSLRVAFFDALQKIGGPEAIETARETLKTTADPMEVAVLSRSLEQQAPAQYREEELNAAREVLSQALAGKLRDRSDVSPLFELLQTYGNESVIPDLIGKVPYWHHYATFALAGLPDGIGIPTLVKLAQDPEISAMGKGDFALLPLTQVATQYPQAASALVEQARSNAIPPTAWPSVATALAGTHLEYGKRIFGRTTPEARLTTEEVNKRLSLIDQIVAVNTNPQAAQYLQQARGMLTAKVR